MKYLDEDKVKSILKKKRLDLALKIYMDREEKIQKYEQNTRDSVCTVYPES